jgi:hypothetical protein
MKASSVVLAVAALAALSGSVPPDEGTDLPAQSFAPDDVVLQVRYDVDTTRVFLRVTQGVPEISVYGDGRVITNTPPPWNVEPSAWPDIEVRHIGPDDVQALVHRAVEAGVGSGADLGSRAAIDGSGDAETAFISVRTASGGLVTTDAPALGDEAAGSKLTRAQRQARQKLVDLRAALRDLPRTLGQGKVDEPRPYQPALVAAVAVEWAKAAGASLGDPPGDPPLAWPGAALPGPGGTNQWGIACVTSPAGPVLPAARTAAGRTPWTSGDKRWLVLIRPLLPHEHSCADLPG